jgi:PIN domain nuclease of toxin-antitoxin system
MILLDSSALLAMSFNEPGGEKVAEVIAGAYISVVNLAEALTILARNGVEMEPVHSEWLAAGLIPLPASHEHALQSSVLWSAGKPLGLSPGDRFCAAVGLIEGAEILTSDRQLSKLQAGLKITLIR